MFFLYARRKRHAENVDRKIPNGLNVDNAKNRRTLFHPSKWNVEKKKKMFVSALLSFSIDKTRSSTSCLKVRCLHK